MATLAEIKRANPEFFSRKNNKFFGTHKWHKTGNIVWSIGKFSHVSRRWVNNDLSLSNVCMFPRPHISVSVSNQPDDTVTAAQPVDINKGVIVGEPVSWKEFNDTLIA